MGSWRQSKDRCARIPAAGAPLRDRCRHASTPAGDRGARRFPAPTPVSLRTNVVANVGGQVAAAAIAVLLAPWFVQRLGLEAWGLVGLLVVVSAWFNLIDVGFTQSITREIARATANDTTPQEAGDLVRCIEWIYLPAML